MSNSNNNSNSTNPGNPTNPSNNSPSSTSSYDKISPIATPYSNFIIEHYVRPQEIDNCLIYSNNNLGSGQTKTSPGECACALAGISYISSDFKNACLDGYNYAGKNNLISNPDPIQVCLSGVPKDYSDSGNIEQYDSWLVGCLNGVKGKH